MDLAFRLAHDLHSYRSLTRDYIWMIGRRNEGAILSYAPILGVSLCFIVRVTLENDRCSQSLY
ncbi:hypothetical protein Hanom_Chr01g00087561 [Helianthus anomalus]